MATRTPQTPHDPLPADGRVRPITRWGESVMHRPQAAVTAYDEALHELVADMAATMYAAEGVGLAACQIGVDLAVFVFDCPDDSGTHVAGVVCNPEVSVPEGADRNLDDDLEGCLSFPGAFVDCARPDRATVLGTGLTGQRVEFTGDGLLARCLQHETDHTRGVVFGDRIPTKAYKRLRKQHDGIAEEFPADWPVDQPRPSAAP